MKKKFSTKWKGSKQPRKQRKYRHNAPKHIKSKMIKSNLAKELRTKYGKRNFRVRKKDVVKVMRGIFKGKKGKVTEINVKRELVFIENIQKTRKDGTKVPIGINPSNLQIQELDLEDKKRLNKLEKKK
ncbi:MAG: 50S ribosomal protein L24 [archaeon]